MNNIILSVDEIIFIISVALVCVLYIEYKIQIGKFIIYIDMDGVIARWNTWATLEDTQREGYFLNCIPEKSIIRGIRLLKFLGVHVCILSATCDSQAAREKSIWLDRYVGRYIQRIFVPYGTNKADYIGGGRNAILVDDYSTNLHQWEASGNKGVKFYNGINGTNGTWTGSFVSKDMSAVVLAFRILSSIRAA